MPILVSKVCRPNGQAENVSEDHLYIGDAIVKVFCMHFSLDALHALKSNYVFWCILGEPHADDISEP